ncbi:hypothetical protein PYCH_17010 [Pyrococcus yayanosii CH1]|uniref:Uncharacterized protein n=2 Tax=Pyrococcus TaxID=2260 RepID=F8AHI9_PYRYC|nr:hypothetical protein PYCH_17010 [Pyrococcus yayanosii CH1]
MKLTNAKPVLENFVCLSGVEALKAILDVLKSSEARGAYVRVFAKDEKGRYYFELLIDSSRALATECELVDENRRIEGDEALRKLAEVVNNPLIIDVYPLDDLSFKLTLAENLSLYSKTHAVPLQDLFGGEAKEKINTAIERAEAERAAEEEERRKQERQRKATKPKPKPVPRGEVIIEVTGDESLKPKIEEAFKEYIRLTKGEIEDLEAKVERVEMRGEIGTGIVNITGTFGIIIEDEKKAEITKRKAMFILNKHVPKIGRISGLKPLVKSLKVEVIAGERVEAMETREREDMELWRLKKPPTTQLGPNLFLTVDPEFKTYFTGFARTLLKDIENSGIRVKRLEIEVYGGVREHEINVYLEGTAPNMDEAKLKSYVTSLAKKHASELSKILNKYVWVNKVVVRAEKPAEEEVSSKVSEVLKKKAELEREVEKLLKEAGVDELAYLMEDKKKESEEILLKSRVEPAIEVLRRKMQDALRAIPRATLRWVKLKWDVQGSAVEVSIEVSLAKLEEEGLFGVFSGVSGEEVKRNATDIITRLIREVSREYNVQIKIRRLAIFVR